jgi:hypothetical protein
VAALAAPASPALPAAAPAARIPSYPRDADIVVRRGYVACVDRATRLPKWVVEDFLSNPSRGGRVARQDPAALPGTVGRVPPSHFAAQVCASFGLSSHCCHGAGMGSLVPSGGVFVRGWAQGCGIAVYPPRRAPPPPPVCLGGASREGVNFREDPDVPALFRATLAHYHGSGYDRGHLAPAGCHKASEEELAETFYLTNVCAVWIGSVC